MNHTEFTIATIGSHSALQILKGAHDEGFHTLAICLKGREKPYQLFGVADDIVVIDDYQDFPHIDAKLAEDNLIFIPHASLVSYLGFEKTEALHMNYFGNKKILHWESDRTREREWLTKAGLTLPAIFEKPEDIDRPVIVKFHGADGGRGYFFATNAKEYHRYINGSRRREHVIQEYIDGVTMYAHYFYSPINQELEIMGFDKRYESNVDALGRVPGKDQQELQLTKPYYVVTGNIPIVIRESFLPQIIDMGEAVVKASQEFVSPGLFGPFCLEMVITPQEKLVVFEISARIVAGTNPYISGSPYTDIKYNEPMSTGRRIAREIKTAIHQNKIDFILQ